ncbi:MAG TPA: hypothetical protein ENK96_09490 [Desulfobulbaceae bacterium]|nr:hypothetical protein [Desulfobulbaceae bacterium]
MRIQKRKKNRFVYGLGICVLLILTWTGVSRAAEEPIQLKLAGSTIKISTFYNGTTLDVTGSVHKDADVVLLVSGPKKDVHLKVKGKVAGILWMNKTDVSLENIPAVYMVYTPAGTGDNLLRPELGIGYKALTGGIAIRPESTDKEFVFAEYVKLMEQSGVYAVHRDAIKYGETSNDQTNFTATLIIPSKMSAGSYRVEAVAIQNGKVLGRTGKELSLELAGLPKTIADLAFGSPLLFGIMAVFIAIATGLIIGVLFKGGGGSH